jgi:hypothetical protein
VSERAAETDLRPGCHSRQLGFVPNMATDRSRPSEAPGTYSARNTRTSKILFFDPTL